MLQIAENECKCYKHSKNSYILCSFLHTTFNLFSTTRTLTSTMLTGLGEASGLAYDIRFSVGIMLILVILLSNGLLNLMKNKLARVSK